jgi:hypothetical protein
MGTKLVYGGKKINKFWKPALWVTSQFLFFSECNKLDEDEVFQA